MLRHVFHASMAAGLHLVNLSSAEGEIGLRAGAADQFFGLINIGDDTNFLNIIAKRAPELTIDSERFGDSLFRAINQRQSPINILLGAKKFIEGWDSWRVSTMGLMNIGRGEGPQIIQLFGRGVRLLGKDRSLRRSEVLEGDHPERLPLLETLNIFGVRAKYMAEFRKYLDEEGIDTEQREIIEIKTEINEDFRGKGLLVIRPRIETDFVDAERLRLELDGACRPRINLTPRTETIVSDGLLHESSLAYEDQAGEVLPADLLALFDWDRIYREIWRFRTGRGYFNLTLDRDVLRRVLEEQCYELRCGPSTLALRSFEDVNRLQQIALMILRKYVEQFYTRARRQWEKTQLDYFLLDGEVNIEDGNFIRRYEAQVTRSAARVLEELQRMIDTPALYQNEQGLPNRVHFDRHLYLPLVLADTSEEQVVKYSPPGLNPGERKFVENLRDYFRNGGGEDILVEWEVFLLRNLPRGHGIGFLVDNEKFFPDFILWLKGHHFQHIAFIDPHGLITGGDLKANPKVQFYAGIKEYESDLNARAGRDDVALHSYIISQTPFDDLRQQTTLATREAFSRFHIYFPNQEIELLLRDILDE